MGELDAPGRPLRRTLLALGVLLASVSEAHVGSPDVIFEGIAGSYPVRVIVRAPGVIPGLADIAVRQLGGPAAEQVTVQPLRWDARTDGGAPPPDVARPVRGEAGLWSGSLWIMTQGSYAVRVEVKGPAGAGVVMVPVAAAPTRSLEMNAPMGAMLALLGLLLFAGAVSIVGAATREAVVPVDGEPDRRRRGLGWLSMAVTFVLLALMVRGGWRWWAKEEAAYKSGLYRPLRLASTVGSDAAGGRTLRVEIDDETWRERQHGPLAPDHGKLMHLFLIREPALDAVAHLHPVRAGRMDVFETPLPALPEGRYRLYADVTHENGFAQTLVDKVGVPGAGAGRAGDPDDSWHIGPPTTDLGDGYSLLYEGGGQPLAAKQELALRFRIQDRAGAPVMPELYMGMLSHAIVTRADGQVFVHLHPSGTVSMAAQMVFGGDPHAGHRTPPAEAVLSFPYEFPQPGRYRMWVQVKVGGRVRTGGFDLDVR